MFLILSNSLQQENTFSEVAMHLCQYSPVWFTVTEMETEISVNGKILIPLTETKKLRKTETKTEKFDTETDKFDYVHFRYRCTSISRHHAGFVKRNTVALAVTEAKVCNTRIKQHAYQTLDWDRASI